MKRDVVVGGQAAGRGPPRVIRIAVLSLLALASFSFVFMLLGMQFFHQYHGPSSNGLGFESNRQMASSVSSPDGGQELWQRQQHGFQFDGVWSPVRSELQLLPYAVPHDVSYRAPIFPISGSLFATIIGDLHEIHAAICDFVVIARLLNATIVLPKIQGPARVKAGDIAKMEGFNYLYDETHFVTALTNDVRVVKHSPKKFRSRTRLQKQPVKTPTRSSPVQYYLDEVLPALQAHGACGLVFSDGGGLQSLLPPELVEYQRLRCRVAFQALRFRREIQNLGVQLVRRLEAHGQPFLVVHLGLERDILAYHGCAELFQDLQTESIQLHRSYFLTSGKEGAELQVDSEEQRHRACVPLCLPKWDFCWTRMDLATTLESISQGRSSQVDNGFCSI